MDGKADGRKNSRPAGIGTGYLSLMMIFVTLCLTALAALSFSAARNEKKFSARSADYTAEYYAADLEAKRTLAEIDSIVSGCSDYRDFMMLAELDEVSGAEYEILHDGLAVSWKTPINDRQNILCRIKFSAGEFEILSWRTVSSGETEEAPLGVWLGE
ncbi:MAG: hypothetical protein K2J73_06525 [Oscillospiraceae bacterium]|nr:hypothetical protein [Oscillospiraceae bacterium]